MGCLQSLQEELQRQEAPPQLLIPAIPTLVARKHRLRDGAGRARRIHPEQLHGEPLRLIQLNAGQREHQQQSHQR